MKTVLLAMLALGMQGQDTGVPADSLPYHNDELGMTFYYPKTWKRVDSKKKVNGFKWTDPKTWRGPDYEPISTNFTAPLEGGSGVATVQVYAVAFNAETEIWQASQRDVNQQMRREVTKQSEEEILGVPLLLTQISWKEKNTPMLTETGLMYSRTPRKFVFRLTAPAADFEKADFAWRNVLQTLKTDDGKLPSTEDPNRKLSATELDSGSFRKTNVWSAPTPVAPKIEKAAIPVDVLYGKQKLQVRIPTGWKAQSVTGQSMVLSNPELGGQAELNVYSSLDTDLAGKALFKLSGKNLQSFTKVLTRKETPLALNKGGAYMASIERTGEAGTGKILSYEAAGVSGDYYWLLSYTSTSPASFDRSLGALRSLTNAMSLDLVQ